MYSFEDDLRSFEELLGPLAARDDVVFVNLGAHDGVLNDPIYPFARRLGWTGLAIEPVPHLYERLVDNYRDLPGVIVEQTAVVPDGCRSPRRFWYVTPDSGSLEHVVEQIGSLDRERVLDNISSLRASADLLPRAPLVIPGFEPENTPLSPHEGALIGEDLERHLGSVEVPCIGFDDLMDRHRIDHIDVLDIDADGADYPILCSIDLDRYCPDVLCIELSDCPPEQQAHCHELLGRHGLRARGHLTLFSTVFTRDR